jgi:hypothetical protein
MKTTTLVFMTAITVTLNHSAIAESFGNMMPPPGPYKSMDDSDQYSPEQNVQNRPQLGESYGYPSARSGQINREVPEWVRQRQVQMEQWMKQQSNMQPQAWNSQPPQWNYNQAVPVPNAYSGRAPGVQDNRFQQTFPSARGPVYGPTATSPEFYQQPVYQGPRY